MRSFANTAPVFRMCEGRKGYNHVGRGESSDLLLYNEGMEAADRDRLCVVLVRTRNPLNIGAVARVMSNFGFLEFRLVQPFEASFREARSAVGAEELLQRAQVFESLAEAIGDCSMVVGTTAVRDRELHQRVEMLPAAAARVRHTLARERVAILFGSEKTGLSTDDLDHCNLLLRIPTREEHVSLNLAQAVAVTLYEIARENAVSRTEVTGESMATVENLERITAVLFENLSASGYVKGDSDAATEQKLRRLVKRLKLSEADAELWLGMLRKMNWKIRQGSTE
jgi:TrmH family RNA methyltransferase